MIKDILIEATTGSLQSIYSIVIIIVPIMIILQILKDYRVLDKTTAPFSFLSKMFNTSQNAVMPLLVGIIIGLSYGAGVIIQAAKEGNLTKRDLFLITVFLVACHAIIEDTLIFVAVGANGIVLFVVRLLAAFLLTYFISKKYPVEELEASEEIKEANVR